MKDPRALADVLVVAAGIAIDLWGTSERASRRVGGQQRIGHPELQALVDKVEKLAAKHPEVASALLEENLSLSIARELRRLMRTRRMEREQLQSLVGMESAEFEDILEGVSGATVPLATLGRLAQALDSKVQLVLVPNLAPAKTERHLAQLVKEAEALLAAPPAAGAA